MLRDVHAFSGFSINDKAAALTFYKETLGCDITDTEKGVRAYVP